MKRFDLKEIMRDPVKRKSLMCGMLIALQAREGREITMERAEEVYDLILKEKANRDT